MTELKIGSTLQKGKYEITKVLGAGNFGITYLATTEVAINGQLGQMNATVNVAIKEFYMKDLNNRTSDGSTVEGTQNTMVKNYRQKFKKEAENLAKLHHPNIVKVIEVFDENNTTYYVMEYIEGGSLDDYIKSKGHLMENEALNCTLEIGKALSYMHQNRMVHLDLKPKNIMRNSKGHLYLIDFGLSKQYDENGEPESSTSIGLGTPGYAPIEQASYKQDGSLPTTFDIYALGASLYKMLTGKTPPESSYVLNEGLPNDVLSEAGVSNNVIAVVEKAMAPIKKNRYQTVTDLSKAISTISSSSIEKPKIEEEEDVTIIDIEDSGKRRKVEINPNTDEIEFRFNEGSHPGSRSYVTHITEDSIALEIYGIADILHEEDFPFNKSRFMKLIETIKNLDIHEIPKFDKDYHGGETLTLKLLKDGEEYYSGYIYGSKYKHDAGTTDANLYLVKSEIEKCIPNFQALLTKEKEDNQSNTKSSAYLSYFFGKKEDFKKRHVLVNFLLALVQIVSALLIIICSIDSFDWFTLRGIRYKQLIDENTNLFVYGYAKSLFMGLPISIIVLFCNGLILKMKRKGIMWLVLLSIFSVIPTLFVEFEFFLFAIGCIFLCILIYFLILQIPYKGKSVWNLCK